MRLESVTWVLGEVIVNTFVLIRNLDKQIWTGLGQKDHCVGPILELNAEDKITKMWKMFSNLHHRT